MPRAARSICLAAALLGLPAAALPSQPAPPASPGGPRQMLIQWMPGEVRCRGTMVSGQAIRRPWNMLGWTVEAAPRSTTLRFAIDERGRPVSISRDGPDYLPFGDDILSAMAASRFPAGKPHEGCGVTFTMQAVPLDQAAAPELMSYTINPLSGRLPEEGWKSIRASGGPCLDPPLPRALIRHIPDFVKIPATPGVRDWSMIRYDLNAAGKPVHAAILTGTGTGNAALNAAGLTAMRASRFTRGAKTGCLAPYWREAGTLPAPDMPEAIRATRVADGNCPDEHGWATPPQLRFPEPYRRRRIEGWAVIRYDVAPWGELGNLTVIASEPTADFGRQAITVLRSARLPAQRQGYVGCVDRVRFDMGPQTDPGLSGSEGAPPA